MDTSNWRPNQGGSGGGDSSMEAGDWRTQLPADSRQMIVNKIMDILKKYLPFSGQEKLYELKNIALRLEEKIYTAATSHSDYMWKISIKLLAMENRSANPMPNSLQSDSAGNSVNPSDPGSRGMQQVNNQGQPLPILVSSNRPQAGQQILPPSIHNNISLSGVQSSAGVSSALPPGSGLSQSTMPNVAGQNSSLQNIQNISGVQQNSVGNSMGEGIPPSNFVSQRLTPGRQQLAPQQQSQNSQHYLYHQQPNNITSSQSHIQQQHQNLLQQPSQQSIMQPTLLQPSSLSTVQQNQQPIIPQSAQPVMQHHQQSVLRQQRQQQQAPIVHQQQASPTQQQQHQLQPSATNLQHNQLIGQQSNYSEMQQQQQPRLLGQQNNLSNVHQLQQHSIGQHKNFSAMHQQHSGPQSSATSQPQQQPQQQLLGTQSGNSTMLNNQHSAHLLQSKVPFPQQNQPTQGLPSQPQLQQQVMAQLQTQSGQLQHQLNMEPQPNLSHRDMQQRLPTSGAFQHQNVIDQQRQLFQQQRAMPEASSTSSDSTAQTGNPNGEDWQDEVYHKMKAMKDKYMPELNGMYQKIIGKLQQQPKGEQLNKLKMVKQVLERCMTFLQVPKSNISPNYKEKLGICERQIVNIISTNKRKPGVTLQQAQGQALPLPHMHSLQQSQQTQSHLTQVQPHENQMNSQMQSVNLQGTMAAIQQNNMGSLQHNSVSPLPGVSNALQNMMGAIQPASDLDPGQNSTMNSLQQVAGGSLQQNVSVPQQANINPLSSQGGMGTLHPNSNMLQHQQLFLHKQLLLQQQFHRQTKKQQQNGQLQVNQLPQLHQTNDANELKLRQQMGVKSESLHQHHIASQRSAYHQQLMTFSPQLLPASSPLISQHPSPQIDQQNLLNSLPKSGTPLQSANSPLIVPSPSTPSSAMTGEFERVNSGVSSLSNAGNIGHLPTGSTQSLAIGTPGISASPLLAEFMSPDGNQGNGASVVSGKSSAIEQPIEHLLKVVKSISQKSLSASVSDIGSVVSMIDRIAGSAPGNGSRAAVGEDLVAMTKCRLQARTFITQDGTTGTRKMKRFTSAMPLNVVSSASSVNDSFKHFNCVEASELESTATSTIKRPRIETSHALLEEIREINQGLIDTVVDISEEDADRAAASVGSEGGEGTIVKCSFSAVALGPNLKLQYASAQMSPIQPLRLLVPANYPNCSPILLDKFPVEVSEEYEDLSVKAKSRFSSCLRSLSQPMSLEDMARTWDVCARAVVSEYAQQSGGGGTFSSKYGAWENCLSAA